ncbi:MAG: methyltransferase [Opitutae bacterium]|nr:methyltransferase [Opitutae bacterium]|tara:strand:- start:2278 stop:3525 length:1248 start_codon:yes stop_codon:yes gene_type:complete
MSVAQKYTEIDNCRISDSRDLRIVLDLGIQELTGVFPKDSNEPITAGPLQLAWCPDSELLQLKQSYDLAEMYGDNYGYRSGLNASMVGHLQTKAREIQRFISLNTGDLVVDVGSNDATFLKSYDVPGIQRVGIDPTGRKFRRFYEEGIELIPDFFSADVFRSQHGDKKARILTSIAMFYDLEDPTSFVRDVASILADDGIWHFEQSYMPSMLRTNAYDTICHEHLEYYTLGVVKKLLESCGLKVLDVQMNAVNGGSFAVTAGKQNNPLSPNDVVIEWLLRQEERMGLSTIEPYEHFSKRVFEHRDNLTDLVRGLVADGKKVVGYGASTKGNVLLQFCGITEADIPCIAEVNEEKFGKFTPGTRIPIVSEEEARAMNPDYFLVLPWHFKAGILAREREFHANGGKFIFPLPEIEIV